MSILSQFLTIFRMSIRSFSSISTTFTYGMTHDKRHLVVKFLKIEVLKSKFSNLKNIKLLEFKEC